MARPPGSKTVYFSRVKEAREALKDKALELHALYMSIITEAIAKSDLETAMKATQWLIEHMPAEDGVAMVDVSVDKPKQVEGKSGPSVNIGFALGGLGEARTLLPAVTIDVEPAGVLDAEANVSDD